MAQWVAEENDGLNGYRCQICGEWVHESQPLECDCEEGKYIQRRDRQNDED